MGEDVLEAWMNKNIWVSYSATLAIATRDSEGTIRAPSALRARTTAAEALARPSNDRFEIPSSWS